MTKEEMVMAGRGTCEMAMQRVAMIRMATWRRTAALGVALWGVMLLGGLGSHPLSAQTPTASSPAGVSSPAPPATAPAVTPGTLPLPALDSLCDPPTAAMVPAIDPEFLRLTSMSLPLSILRPEYPVHIAEPDAFRPRPPQPATDTEDLAVLLAIPTAGESDADRTLNPRLSANENRTAAPLGGIVCGKSTRRDVEAVWEKVPPPVGADEKGVNEKNDNEDVFRIAELGDVLVSFAPASSGPSRSSGTSVASEDAVVLKLVVQLTTPKSVAKFSEMLELGSLHGEPIMMQTGATQELLFPERGVRFYLTQPCSRHTASQGDVRLLVIEAPTASMFVERAAQRWYLEPDAVLPDLRRATAMDANHAPAYRLLAQVQSLLGHPKAALRCAQKVTELEPSNEIDAQQVARFLMMNGRWQEATTLVEKLVASPLPKGLKSQCARARSEIFLGDLALMCVPPNFPEAVKSYTWSVGSLHDALARGEEIETHMAARQMMIDAYIGGSYAMALSDWLGRDEALNMWIISAESLLEVSNAEDSRRFACLLRAMSVGAVSPGFFNADAYLHSLNTCSGRLLRSAASAYDRIQLRWETSLAIFDAAWIFRRQNQRAEAEAAANQAIAEFGEIMRVQQDESCRRLASYLIFRMEFIRSINALERLTSGSGGSETASGSANLTAATLTAEEVAAQFRQTLQTLGDPAWLPISEQFRVGVAECWLATAYWNLGRRIDSKTTAVRATQRLDAAMEAARQDDGGVSLNLPLLVQCWRSLAALHRNHGSIESADHCAKMQFFFERIIEQESRRSN